MYIPYIYYQQFSTAMTAPPRLGELSQALRRLCLALVAQLGMAQGVGQEETWRRWANSPNDHGPKRGRVGIDMDRYG